MANASGNALRAVPSPDDDDIDISEFEALVPQRPNKCWFATKLNEEQQRKLTKAKRSNIPYDTIHTVLVKWGIPSPPSTTSMGHHFLGRCGCANAES